MLPTGEFRSAGIVARMFICLESDDGRAFSEVPLLYHFEELDDITRKWMLIEFEQEEQNRPYRGPGLSTSGIGEYHHLMQNAIQSGNEETLAQSLNHPEIWVEFEPSPQGGVRKVIPDKASVTLARHEFNLWYVRGLSRRLMEEGEEYCQIYKASQLPEPCDACAMFENKVFKVRFVYNGHRARQGIDPSKEKFSIPYSEHCHHSIRRLDPSFKAMILLDEARYKLFI